MATTIVTKYGGDAPAASDIVRGELAVDTENGRLYTENSSGAVVEIGLNPSGNVNVTGTASATNVSLPDDGVLSLGTSDELTLKHHNSGYSHLINTTGTLFIDSDSVTFRDDDGSPSNMVVSQTGVDVTGTVTADGLTSSDFIDIRADDSEIYFTNAANTDYYRIKRTGASGDLAFDHFNGTSVTERMRIDSGGSVLIGKSTPTDLHNTWNHLIIGEKGAIISENGAGGIDGITLADNVYIDADTGSYAYQTTAAASQITQSGGVIAFSNAASGSAGAALTPVERMRILADGSVSQGNTVSLVASNYNNQAGAAWHEPDGHYEIATTSNVAPLEIGKNNATDGSLVVLRKQSTVVGSIGSRGGVVSHIVLDPRSGGAGLTAAGASLFPTNNAGAVSDGAIDLGYSVSGSNYRFKDLWLSGGVRGTSTLDITIPETAGGAIQLEFGNNTNNARRTVRAYKDNFEPVDADDGVISLGQAANRWKDLFLSNNLLLGTTTPSTKLTVQGTSTGDVVTVLSGATSNTNVGMIVFRDGGADFCGQITTNGSTNTTAYNTPSSDQRLKENIADADDAGSKIDAIQVRKFDWIKSGLHQDYGMVAQELQTVAPEAVAAPEDPEDMMGVDYSKLVPMLVKEVQSLRARVAQLES